MFWVLRKGSATECMEALEESTTECVDHLQLGAHVEKLYVLKDLS